MSITAYIYLPVRTAIIVQWHSSGRASAGRGARRRGTRRGAMWLGPCDPDEMIQASSFVRWLRVLLASVVAARGSHAGCGPRPSGPGRNDAQAGMAAGRHWPRVLLTTC